MSPARDLGEELARVVETVPEVLVVAWSGGIDSTALLDLAIGKGALADRLVDTRVVAAHLDHAMRPNSAEDAAALNETARAWGIDYRAQRVSETPASEAEARAARYAFLDEVCDEVGADQLWTAHHADDQIETILFRVARGTGVDGLTGIPSRTGRLVRPLLAADPPIWRSDLEAHVARRALPIRVDPTNARPIASRNRIRHEVLPLLEEIVHGTRPALLRLGRNAGRAAEELEALAAFAADRGGFEAEVWADAPTPLRRSLLRFAAARLGVGLSEAATEAALSLDPAAQSGRGLDLPGGLRFERTFDRWVLRRGAASGMDAGEGSLLLSEAQGEGRLDLGDRTLLARWGPDGSGSTVRVDVVPDAWPLVLRAWSAGDRIRRPFGTSTLAKLWSEDRIPVHERRSRWVLVDAAGRVLAAEGLGAAHSDPTISGSRSSTTAVNIQLDVPT